MASTPLSTFRFTPDDLAALDSLGKNRTETLRRLIHAAAASEGAPVPRTEIPGQESMFGPPPDPDPRRTPVPPAVKERAAESAERAKAAVADQQPCRHWRRWRDNGLLRCMDCKVVIDDD